MKINFTLLFIFLNLSAVTAQWEVQNIDANNINAPVEADGFLFHNNITNAAFEVPKFSGKYCIYASNLWMGGLDQNGVLHVAAQTYKQNGTDFWPAPLTTGGNTLPPSTWNNVWHVDRIAIDNHIANYNTQGYQLPQDLIDWPGSGYNGVSQIFAPFTDINNNGVYDPSYGDYPYVLGDEILYLMYNDKYGAHTETGGIPIEAEVYSTVYAYNNTGSINIDNTIFVRHRIRNRSQINTYSNFYVGLWNDFDIGNNVDDLIGTDINRNMVYGYNTGNFDTVYGSNPPAIGMKILNQTLHNSMFYENSGTAFYNNAPTNPNHYYNYLKSIWKDGTALNFGLDGYQTPSGNTNFCFSGNTNPDFTQSWTMTSPKDYNVIGSTGPYTIAPNGYITIDVAYVYAKGTSSNGLAELNIAADVVQNFYNATINSIEEVKETMDWNIYPNPVEDVLFINPISLVNANATIQITDLSGSIIFTKKSHLHQNFSIDVAHLKQGIYFVKIIGQNEILSKKFVKR